MVTKALANTNTQEISEPKVNETAKQRNDREKLHVLIDQACKDSHASAASIQKAALGCLKHWKEYGDARPMDRLVKGVESAHQQPLIFWVKQNSPIYWNADKDVKVRKEDDKNYVPLNMKQAEEVAYHNTAEAKARNQRPLEPFSAKTVFDRIDNLGRMLQNVMKDDSKREFDDSYGSPGFVTDMIAKIQEELEPYKEKAEAAHKRWMKNERARQDAEKGIGKRRLIKRRGRPPGSGKGRTPTIDKIIAEHNKKAA